MTRLLEADAGTRRDAEFRQAALDAAVATARPIECALPSSSPRGHGEMWERMIHSLSHRGISREAYLQITGTPGSPRDPRRDGARSRSSRCAARLSLRPSSPPRRSSPSDAEVHRGSRIRPPSARAGRGPDAAVCSICARPDAWRRCARISQHARRSRLIAAAAEPIPLAQAAGAREALDAR